MRTVARHPTASLALAALLPFLFIIPCRAAPASIRVCFAPPGLGGCDPLFTVVHAISVARKSILVQMYSLTSDDIVDAMVAAHNRGINVRVIADRSQFREDRSDTRAVSRLVAARIPVLIDSVRGLMHDKIMIIDGETVLTGSFNYTWSAEHRNAENLVVIDDPDLAQQYKRNWAARAAVSSPLASGAASAGASGRFEQSQVGPAETQASGIPAGPVRGNRRSMIFQWSGCPYYDEISERNRVEFPSVQAAEAAGYRPAKGCR